jgi:GT2 family glycosyltransferase
MTSAMPKVYIIVLNWNDWASTLECLESVYRLDYPSYEVVLCDNASTDGTVAMVERWAGGEFFAPCRSSDSQIRSLTQPPIGKPIIINALREDCVNSNARTTSGALTIIRIAENRGYASGNNAGIRYAKAGGDAAFVWVLNNDTVVVPGALSALVERANEDPRIGLCGSLLMSYDEPGRVQAAGGAVYRPMIAIPRIIGAGALPDALPSVDDVEATMSFVIGASMLVSMRFIDEVGLMSEDYFLYFEEIDWVMRSKAKFRLAFARASTVYHKVGASAGSHLDWRKRSRISDLCAIRNRLLITRRHFAPYYPLVFITVVGVLIRRLLRGQPDRAKEVLRMLLGPESYRLPLPNRIATVPARRG